jgi:AraC family transcriptional regulator, regulatory protein of adaptative response / methylated-DNA-[protein]-cysteine methyltransferase
MEIKFTVGSSPLGKLLVATSEKGLCRVSLRASAAELVRALCARYPGARITRDDRALAPLRSVILRQIAGRPAGHRVPLDLRGTDFQQSVWKELLRIPSGSTRSYGDVARAIGKPKATRAVAQACGANPVPVIVPCHRVIQSDGRIGGYTGGLQIKRALLGAEGVELS